MSIAVSRIGGGRLILAAALLLVSFNLRTTLTSLGPVLPELVNATGITIGAASLLIALPSLCFGLFAPLAPPLSRQLGIERTVLAMMLALAAGTALRWAASPAALFGAAIISGAAIGVVNVLLPSLVKRDFSNHVALMTGLYTMVLSIGSAAAAAASAPLAAIFHSWAESLAIWAIPALIAALALIPTLGPNHRAMAPGARGGAVWRSGLAWQVTLFMGFQSAFTYCSFGWLAPILQARGMSAIAAGLVLSVSVLVQVPTTLGGAPFALRFRDQRAPSVLCLGVALIGFLGCLYAPLHLVWASAVLMGIGQGAVFSIALMIIVLRSPDPATATELSGMAQCAGYIIAAIGPFLLGLTHQWRGNWSAAGPMVILFAAIGALAAMGAGRQRLLWPSA